MARSTLHKWIKDYNNSGSFSAKDNRTDKEKELIKLQKENKQLKMENDILKASGADNGAKIAVIKANRDKYSICAMCREFSILRDMFSYHFNKK